MTKPAQELLHLSKALRTHGSMPPILPAGVPVSQGLSSTTFTPPPLDGSSTPAEIYDWVFQHNKTHPVFVTPTDNGRTKTLLWGEVLGAMYRGAKLLRETIGTKPGTPASPIVGILSTTGQFILHLRSGLCLFTLLRQI